MIDLRLTPSYMLIIFFNALILPYLGSGPYWKWKVGLESDGCWNYWWANIFYVNNYVRPEKTVIFHSIRIYFSSFFFFLIVFFYFSVYVPIVVRFGWLSFVHHCTARDLHFLAIATEIRLSVSFGRYTRRLRYTVCVHVRLWRATTVQRSPIVSINFCWIHIHRYILIFAFLSSEKDD